MADRFKSERDLIRNKLRGIFDHRYENLCDLEIEGWKSSEPLTYDERTKGEYIKIKVGDSWGERWDCAWFHITGKVPASAKGKCVIARIDFSGEGCVFSEQGIPLQGLTLGRRHRQGDMLGADDKTIIDISECSTGDEMVDLWIDAGCNSLFGDYVDNGKFVMASISILNIQMNQLYYDFQVLKSLMEQLPENNAQRNSIFNSLLKACYELKFYSEDEAIKARKILDKELSKKGGDPSLKFTAVGHAHLDLAWLWPIRESKRKAVRTFATALRNMEKYPDYCFGQSQPQQFKWIKDEQPELYTEIKQRIAEGRLEPQGGMWVEADTNTTGGESLIRQMIYGKAFFKEEFDKDIKVLWLPDVFGYSSALPQILKKCGIDYFMTIKLSWSKINEFPYHTFNWKGLGDFEVLAHMPPEGNYGSWAEPRNIASAERQFHEKGISDEALILYGVSDGGGGPGEDHLEAIERVKNINGLSPVNQEPAINFFERINGEKSNFPTWHGELYLEYHQGTYTTQAKNKLYNRKMEHALREAEFALVLADMVSDGKMSCQYPKDKLDEIWQETLLYQFHDILPGSSIKRVYDESVERYMAMYEETVNLVESAYGRLAQKLTDNSGKRDIAIFNSLSWEREEWINTASGWIKVMLPAMGYVLIGTGDAGEEIAAKEFVDAVGGLKADGEERILENENLLVKFDKNGQIISMFDKCNEREAIAFDSCANRLTVYNDPGDAWDFSLHYKHEELGEFKLESERFYIEGPDATAEFTYSYGSSFIKQNLILRANSGQLTINCFADWQESGKMLRAEIPLNIKSDEVKCNIQFGNISRPTHQSSSWDYAKYEICAQKWIDISNRAYGIAILNDCKYGYGVTDNNISMNLLRSPSHPGAEADRGAHVFSYAIYPHMGDCFMGSVDERAYEFNIKPAVVQPDPRILEETSAITAKSFSWFDVISDSDSVMIETVKKAENNGDIIVRLYEYSGAETKALLNLPSNICVESVYLTDMLENEICELKLSDGSVTIPFGEFEIQTVRLKMQT